MTAQLRLGKPKGFVPLGESVYTLILLSFGYPASPSLFSINLMFCSLAVGQTHLHDFDSNEPFEKLDLQDNLIYQVPLYLDLLGTVLTSGLLLSGLRIYYLPVVVSVSPLEGFLWVLFLRE